MRERGVQARRAREADSGARPPRPDSGLRFWQVLAVVGLIAATAGWTTVAVIALRPAATPAPIADASPADVLPSEDPFASGNASDEPPVESHAVADLEALLPADVNGTSLTRESWTGDLVLGDDTWSTSMTSFLTTSGKTVADLQAAQAYDAASSLDLSAGAFRVPGVGGAALRDAIIAAYKGDYPDLKLTPTTIDGLEVTTGDFGDGSLEYWYIRDDVVFDIQSGDPAIVQAALAALPAPGASGSAKPTASEPAGPSQAPSPS